MGSADIIANGKSSRYRGRGNLGNDNHPGVFASATDELGFWPGVQEGSLSWAQESTHGHDDFDLQSKTAVLLA